MDPLLKTFVQFLAFWTFMMLALTILGPRIAQWLRREAAQRRVRAASVTAAGLAPSASGPIRLTAPQPLAGQPMLAHAPPGAAWRVPVPRRPAFAPRPVPRQPFVPRRLVAAQRAPRPHRVQHPVF